MRIMMVIINNKMNIRLDLNSDELVTHVARLERISEKAMKKAVRGTLNSLAFDVKGKKGTEGTFVKEAKKDFTNRTKNFFKSNSGVGMARGTDLRSMEATVGMFAKNKNTGSAIDNMDAQMRGGLVNNRKFVPMDKARITGSKDRMIRGKNRLKNNKSKFGKIVKVNSAPGRTDGEKFVTSVLLAGEGNVVETDRSLIRVKKINGRKSGRFWDFDLVGLYYIRRDASYKVKNPTNTMGDAAIKSMRKEQEIFKKEAERQLMFIE